MFNFFQNLFIGFSAESRYLVADRGYERPEKGEPDELFAGRNWFLRWNLFSTAILYLFIFYDYLRIIRFFYSVTLLVFVRVMRRSSWWRESVRKKREALFDSL